MMTDVLSAGKRCTQHTNCPVGTFSTSMKMTTLQIEKDLLVTRNYLSTLDDG